MSGVMHPVGPEPSQTYWVRRLAVVAAALVALAVIIALLVNAGGGTTAVPATTPTPLPPVATTDTASPTTSPTAAESPSASATPSATSTPTASDSPAPTSSTPASSTKPSATPAAGSVACRSSDLRATLTGKGTLKQKQDNTFSLSLINGSSSTCIVSVTDANFELKIYSGTDRIWSTKDCSTAVKPIKEKVETEKAVEWTMTWDGRRSRSDCKQRPELPLPGTYFATAQLEGAKPVQLRMVIRG